jgi:hypothetical protein
MIERRILTLEGSFNVRLENNKTRVIRNFYSVNELKIDLKTGFMRIDDELFRGVTYVNTENEDNIHVMYSDGIISKVMIH